MMRHLLIIVLFLVAGSVQAQALEGFAIDHNSNQPLQGAHVRNLSKKQLVTTGANGAFRLPVAVGDSILITFVGYADYFLIVKESHTRSILLIPLQETEVTLDDVVVTPFSEYPQKPVIELDSLVAMPMLLPGVPYDFQYDPRDELMPSKMAPTVGIRLNFEKFTKRKKEKVHYAQSLDQDEKWKIAEQKFNREWLTEITKLEGDALTYFIAYCNFSVDYLAQATLLDIQDHVLAKLERYTAEKEPK